MPAVSKASEDRLKPGFGAVPIGQNPTFAVEFFEPNGRVVPYLEAFNFNIQRQLTPNMLFEVGYLATMGHKLVVPSDRTINQVRPELIRAGKRRCCVPSHSTATSRLCSRLSATRTTMG